MRGFAKIVIAGNLTRDPELRTTPTGRSVASFGVAVNRNRRDSSANSSDDVNFYNCSAWGPQGETIAKYLHRGDSILLSGRPFLRTYRDRNGAERYSLDVDVDDFTFISGPRDGGASSGGYSSSYGSGNFNGPSTGSQDFVPSDIPEGELSLDNPIPSSSASSTAPDSSNSQGNSTGKAAGAKSRKSNSSQQSAAASDSKSSEAAPSEIVEGEISLDEIPF